MTFHRSQFFYLKLILPIVILIALTTFGTRSSVTAAGPNVDWEELHLNAQQAQLINQVEAQWKVTAGEILPQIEGDKAELMQLLNSPTGDQSRIMELQNRINANKIKLHNAAMQSFLKKKDYLDATQQEQLQRLLGPSMH